MRNITRDKILQTQQVISNLFKNTIKDLKKLDPKYNKRLHKLLLQQVNKMRNITRDKILQTQQAISNPFKNTIENLKELNCNRLPALCRDTRLQPSRLRQHYIICLTTYDLPGYCRLRRQPFDPYFMYIYHFISIDLESSRSCNSLYCKSLHKEQLFLY